MYAQSCTSTDGDVSSAPRSAFNRRWPTLQPQPAHCKDGPACSLSSTLRGRHRGLNPTLRGRRWPGRGGRPDASPTHGKRQRYQYPPSVWVSARIPALTVRRQGPDSQVNLCPICLRNNPASLMASTALIQQRGGLANPCSQARNTCSVENSQKNARSVEVCQCSPIGVKHKAWFVFTELFVGKLAMC